MSRRQPHAEIKLSLTNPKQISPIVSIGVPVYNQEKIIGRNIYSILQNTSSNFEIILIDDASTDCTLKSILGVFTNEIFENFPNLCGVRVYRNRKSRFETFCDNLLIEDSLSGYFLEIQADMFIEQLGYDQKLIDAIGAHDDIIAISGRGVHKISEVVTEYAKTAGSDRSRGKSIPRHIVNVIRTRIRMIQQDSKLENQISDLTANSISDRPLFTLQTDFLNSGAIGQLGLLIETKIEPTSLKDRKIYVGETIMRGPLIIDLKKLKSVGGWDQGGFLQGYDDHDFCLRAYVVGGYRVGYVPISFASPTSDGTTRKKKTLMSEFSILANLIRIQQSRKKSQLYLATIMEIPNLPGPEVRNF
jgi:hypothetical protein